MFNVIIKAVIIYAFILLTMRLMGKRQVGQLQPFDLVISIIIAEVAALPMANAGIPLTYGIAPVITLLFLHNLLAFITSKSEKLRAFFSGKSVMLIKKGIIDKKEMCKLDYNLNDLLEQLRAKNVISLSDVYYAILETNGNLNVVLKPEKAPLTPGDMSISPANEGFHYAIIMDGKLNRKNISMANLTIPVINKAVSKMGFSGVKNVLIATVSETGQFFSQDINGIQNSANIRDLPNG